jgi:hypothetical protein
MDLKWIEKNTKLDPVVFACTDPEFSTAPLASTLPVAKPQPINPGWKPNHRFEFPVAIIDPNGHVQVMSGVKLPGGSLKTDFGCWNILTRHFGDATADGLHGAPFRFGDSNSRAKQEGTHPMWILAVSSIKRLACAFVGLLAGDAILLVYLLQNAIRLRADLIALHMGEPGRQIPQAIQTFALYARLSFIGWLFVGLPIALLLPAHSIRRLPWPLRPLVGAALGPLALFLIFVLVSDVSRAALAHGHMVPGMFTGTASLWPLSILVSTVAFVVYVALLRKENVVAQ